MWEPQTYLTFEAERTRPARDLLAALDVESPARVVDLGCGTGTSTRLLAQRWPGADVLGIDSSPEMIERATAGSARVRYEIAEAAQWRPDGAVGLLFSNALLQWVPGHLELLPRWLRELAPGGLLAAQMPANFAEPAHVLLGEVCARPTWRDRLEGLPGRHEFVHEPRTYLTRLAEPGRRLDIWETTYLHRLDGPDPVLRWMSGTALRPVLAAIDSAAERDAFLAEYAEELRAAYPPEHDGRTTLPFRRLFVVAGPA